MVDSIKKRAILLAIIFTMVSIPAPTILAPVPIPIPPTIIEDLSGTIELEIGSIRYFPIVVYDDKPTGIYHIQVNGNTVRVGDWGYAEPYLNGYRIEISDYFEATEIGTFFVHYVVEDSDGEWVESSGVIVTVVDTVVDTTPPETTHTLEGVLGEKGWYISNVNVTLSATDASSGIAYTEYRINEGSWIVYTGEVQIINEGVIFLHYRSVDGAGNIEDVKEVIIKIDKTAPVISHNLSGTEGEQGWYVSDVIVSITFTEATSGLKYLECNVNGTGWFNYSVPITISLEGVLSFSYRSADIAGNEFPEIIITIKIDKTTPVISHSLSGIEGEQGWYVSDVIVGITFIEASSGLKYLEYNVNGTGWFKYSVPITISLEGILSFSYRSADVAGNEFPETTITIKIDKTAPETELIITNGYTDDEQNLYVTYDSTFVVVGSDEHSGVKQSFYRINSSDWIEFIEPFNLIGVPGEYIIDYYSVDVAGNVELVKSITVILRSEFEESYQGFGMLRINGQIFCGVATLSISENSIQMEVKDQVAIWDIVCNFEFKNFKIYTGVGEIGRIKVIVLSCRSFIFVVAFGTGVFFFGTKLGIRN